MVRRKKGRVALCFPGQLQRVPEGTGRKDGGGGDALPHPFFQTAWEAIGFHPFSFRFQRDEEDRCLNLKLQVASYLRSMVSFDRYRYDRVSWDCITEHSMGIYAALAAAGSVTFEDGLEITRGIGLILEEMGAETAGGMAVVIGLEKEQVQGICIDMSDGLYVSNMNGSRHFVISGRSSLVDRGVALALEQGAVSAQRLTFNTPLHSPLMEPITHKVRRFLQGFSIKAPATPVISHWGGRPLSRPDQVREFLAEELSMPVDWEGCVKALIGQGVTSFVEVGSSDTLTKLIRWIDRDIEAASYRHDDGL